ncbi:MAG: ATP-grasp domain-containing protein [Spirochaetales bacterium]|nr:ATP-grasp domain-containing protein [Spirochaetales bacterium]
MTDTFPAGDGAVVAVLYGRLLPDAGLDDQDILNEAAFISGALRELGYEPVWFEVGPDTSELERELLRLRPARVFNLADAIDGREDYVTVAPDMLERLGLPYSGTSAKAMRLASNKPEAKKIMTGAGIPTPPVVNLPLDDLAFQDAAGAPKAFIIKPVSGSASDGIDDDSVLRSRRDVENIDAERLRGLTCGEAYIEPFIPGREFAVALLEGAEGPEVFPPSEILFEGYPKDKPKIVGYAAKWLADSFEYKNTPRQFPAAAADGPIISRLRDLAVRCWNAFGLGGYARMDFRVDSGNEAWLIDINPNPCLSADAGFMAAAGRAGLTINDVVARIVSFPSGKKGINDASCMPLEEPRERH